MKLAEIGSLRALAMLLRQHDPVPVALERIARRGGPAWAQAAQASRQGSSLATALAGILPGQSAATLDCAPEELPSVLDELASLLQRSEERRRDWKQILAYPAFVGLAFIGMLYLMGVTMEPFVKLFEGMSLSLPVPTRLVIAVINGMNNPLVILSAALVGGVVFYGLFVNPSGRLRLPVIGKEMRAREAQSFLSWLAFLIRAQRPWPEAFRSAAAACGVPPIRQQLLRAAAELERGSDVARASRLCLGWFPELERWLLAQASEADDPGQALQEASRLLVREARVQGPNGFAVVETAAIFMLCLGVGFVVLSVFLPLYQLVGNLG